MSTMTSLLMRHGMQRKKNRAELFGELVMREQNKWRSYAIRFGALESEADDVISESLTYLYSRPELDWTERLMCLTVKCRAKNCRRGRSNKRIGLIEDLMPSQQRFIIKDNEMGVDDRIEYEELYTQAVEDIRQSKEARYTELLTRVCADPQTSVVEVGRELGMLTNTASGVMRRIRLYLQEKEADYAKA
jgi:hypothetical protein